MSKKTAPRTSAHASMTVSVLSHASDDGIMVSLEIQGCPSCLHMALVELFLQNAVWRDAILSAHSAAVLSSVSNTDNDGTE
jgi:hypothetical protein